MARINQKPYQVNSAFNWLVLTAAAHGCCKQLHEKFYIFLCLSFFLSEGCGRCAKRKPQFFLEVAIVFWYRIRKPWSITMLLSFDIVEKSMEHCNAIIFWYPSDGRPTFRPIHFGTNGFRPTLFTFNPGFVQSTFIQDLYSFILFLSNFSPFPFFVQK